MLLPLTPLPLLVGVDRSSLTSHLVAEARATYPHSVTFHWESDIKRVDFEKKQVIIK